MGEAVTPVRPAVVVEEGGGGSGGGEGEREWVPGTPRFRLPEELRLPMPVPVMNGGGRGGGLMSPVKGAGEEDWRGMEEGRLEVGSGAEGVGVAV
jgi:hypothetical protein